MCDFLLVHNTRHSLTNIRSYSMDQILSWKAKFPRKSRNFPPLFSIPKFIKIFSSHCAEPHLDIAIKLLDIHFNIIHAPDPFPLYGFPLLKLMSNSHSFYCFKGSVTFRNLWNISNAVGCYNVQVLSPRPTHKLQFSTCLFSILTATASDTVTLIIIILKIIMYY